MPTAIAALVLALALGAIEFASGPGREEEQCTPKQAQSYTGEKVKVERGVQTLEHEIGRLRSGYDRDEVVVKTRDDVQLPAGGKSVIGEAHGALSPLEGEGDEDISAKSVFVEVTPQGGDTLLVDSCIKTAGVVAGRYSGDIRIRGDEIETLTIPITATAKRAGYALWVAVAVFSGAFGFLLRALANVGQLAEPPPASGARKKRTVPLKDAWRAYVTHWSYPGVLFVSGIGVAAGWIATYVTDETWGANVAGELPEFLAATFAGAIAGATLPDFVGAIAKAGKKD